MTNDVLFKEIEFSKVISISNDDNYKLKMYKKYKNTFSIEEKYMLLKNIKNHQIIIYILEKEINNFDIQTLSNIIMKLKSKNSRNIIIKKYLV